MMATSHFMWLLLLLLSLARNSTQQQQPIIAPQPNPIDLNNNNPNLNLGQQVSGGISQTIYQFLKSNQATTSFASLLERIAQQNGDRTIISMLSGDNQQNAGLIGSNGFTVFAPSNEALQNTPMNPDQLRNDIYNLIVRDRLPLEALRNMNGQNLTRTFGYWPRLNVRVVRNFYLKQLLNAARLNGNPGSMGQQQAPFDQNQNMMFNNQQQQQPNMYPNQQQMYQHQTYPPNMPRMDTSVETPQQPQPVGENPAAAAAAAAADQAHNRAPRQAPPSYPNQMGMVQVQQPGWYQQQQTTAFPGQTTVPSSVLPGQPFIYNDQSSLGAGYYGQNNQSDSASVYEMYTYMYNNQQLDGPPISPKLPLDQLFLINNAIITDKYELSNGVVYVINAYPRYYEKSILQMLSDNDINGLSTNLNFWITRAAQSVRLGDENLRNALSANGRNTYFLPTDQAFNKFTDRERLNNNTFLFELFRTHRVSERILFDYYLDDPQMVAYTDAGLPVSTQHRRVNGQEEIEISIGHVKGRILPEFRNIYCASGVIHLVDTVLGVPSRNAYQELSYMPELSTFRVLVDRNPRYRQLLDQNVPIGSFGNNRPYFPNQMQQQQQQPRLQRQPTTEDPAGPSEPPQAPARKRRQNPNVVINPQMPGQQLNNLNQATPFAGNYGAGYDGNQVGAGGGYTQQITVLAPTDAALLAIRDDLMRNDTAIDQLLSAHIITNRVYYTDHDESTFVNGQVYQTMNPAIGLQAIVIPELNSGSNRVTLQVQANPSIRTTIINGNGRVSNGVIHIVDKALSQNSVTDVTTLLERYSSSNSPGSPAFSQFVDALRITGIFNDLRQPAKKYTLFIPTDSALSRYQNILAGNDINMKKQLIYRHICLDQNLQSTNLNNMINGMPSYNQPFGAGNTNNPQQYPQAQAQAQQSAFTNPQMNQQQFQQQQQQQPQQQQPHQYGGNQFTPQYNQGNQLICRNALGQDLTLTKDSYGLVSRYQGQASAKVINDFPGVYSSAYLLEKPLLNTNLPNYGLNSVNSSSKLTFNFSILLLLVTFYFLLQ